MCAKRVRPPPARDEDEDEDAAFFRRKLPPAKKKAKPSPSDHSSKSTTPLKQQKLNFGNARPVSLKSDAISVDSSPERKDAIVIGSESEQDSPSRGRVLANRSVAGPSRQNGRVHPERPSTQRPAPASAGPQYNITTLRDIIQQRDDAFYEMQGDPGPGPSDNDSRLRRAQSSRRSATAEKEAVLDLCTPSPEPAARQSATKRPNPFAAYAYEPRASSSRAPAVQDERPSKRRRTGSSDRDTLSAVPQDKVATRLRKRKGSTVPPLEAVIDLTEHDDATGPSRLVPNGLLGAGPRPLQPVPERTEESPAHERTPLRPNGLLSSPRVDERTPLRPNGLLSSPTASPAQERTPLRPNGLLSSPTATPIEEPAPPRVSSLTPSPTQERGPQAENMPPASPQARCAATLCGGLVSDAVARSSATLDSEDEGQAFFRNRPQRHAR